MPIIFKNNFNYKFNKQDKNIFIEVMIILGYLKNSMRN